jgi:toxin CptA
LNERLFFMPPDLFHFVIAFGLAGLLGFAIQRGGTCTVAAIDEIVIHRRGSRFFALLEAAIWVAGGLFIFWSLKVSKQPMIAWDITWLTILGAALLGLGAVINGACVVGTISRIGNFEWMFVSVSPSAVGLSLLFGFDHYAAFC